LQKASKKANENTQKKGRSHSGRFYEQGEMQEFLFRGRSEIDAELMLCHNSKAVLGRTVISVIVAITLPIVATPLSARSCILSNVASEKACKPGCCANKTCCKTSEKNRATPSQPLAKSGTDQQNIVVSPPVLNVVSVNQPARTKSVLPRLASCSSYSSATLALICIRLI
jgi:hypothetical protein